ncbi:MAG: helix-turn-helix transcriptional regulator, partial [Methylococcales bacterium]|nr:helix-turn-helix transcriptional regulator [Methylococcales bacterium]
MIAVTVQYYEPSLYQASSKLEKLCFTPRQTEVILSLLKGQTYVSISEKLCLSKYTVNDHIKSIYQELGIHNR